MAQFIGWVLGLFIAAWILMLMIGVAHHEFFPGLTPFGFWASLGILVVFRVIFALLLPGGGSRK